MKNAIEARTVRRVLELGKVDYRKTGQRDCWVTLEVTLKYGPNTTAPHLDIDLQPCLEVVEFTMSGSVWNPRRSDIYTGGQNCDEIAALFPENKQVQRLVEIWSRWHLNTMTPGTRKQEDYLRTHPVKVEYPASHYTAACDALRAVGLNPDGWYNYGSAWLVDRLPDEIEREIRTLIAE